MFVSASFDHIQELIFSATEITNVDPFRLAPAGFKIRDFRRKVWSCCLNLSENSRKINIKIDAYTLIVREIY